MTGRCDAQVMLMHQAVTCTRRPDGHEVHEAGPLRCPTRPPEGNELADEALASIGGSGGHVRPTVDAWLTWTTP